MGGGYYRGAAYFLAGKAKALTHFHPFYQIPQMWQVAIKQGFGFHTTLDSVRFFESKKNQVSLLRLKNWGCQEDLDEVGDDKELLNLATEISQHINILQVAQAELPPEQASEAEPEILEVVAKYCVWSDAEREFNVLQKAYDCGLAVPRPVCRLGNILFVVPVKGHRLPAGHSQMYNQDLGKWLKSFHQKMTPPRARGVFSRGDCVLRNFLITDKGLFSFDFEEAYFAPPEYDLGELAANLLPDEESQVGQFSLEQWLSPVASLLRGYQQKVNLDLVVKVMKMALQDKCQFHPDCQEKFKYSLSKLEQVIEIERVLESLDKD